MHIATLLTNPLTPLLDRTTVESLRNAWGGGDAVWLDPAVAAEFTLPAMPQNRWEVWQGLQSIGIDLVVQPAEGRKKRLLIADMDSTMIEQECIDELAEEAGVGAHVAGITARAMNGELDFEDALRKRVGLLRGLPEAVIARVIKDRITLMPGGTALLTTMKANGAYDLGMLGLAGAGVALHAKPAVAAQCDIRINHGDLTALLYLQGYARTDFA
jgi:phosphoserine phosphatase